MILTEGVSRLNLWQLAMLKESTEKVWD